MNSSSLAIQIIPDLTIDDKYAAIINDAHARIASFTQNALKNDRIEELFDLDKSGFSKNMASKILKADGRLSVGFQFEARADANEENFVIFVRKVIREDQKFKYYLMDSVQQILLQLISLEDRRTVAIFSMLNSSLDMGYRILTTVYGNQLKRLIERVPDFISENMAQKLEKLTWVRSGDAAQLWDEKEGALPSQPAGAAKEGDRRGSDDNILSVLADDGTFNEINELVRGIVTRSARIESKRKKLEENPDLPRREIYEQMIREDFSQLENCYARMHIYLKAYYKNAKRRNQIRNRILRQFFGAQIEDISGETGLLEDLLSLKQDDYFKNIDRHSELKSS